MKRSIVWPLTGTMCLATTSSTAVWPIFAKRLGEFGSGVAALGLMTALYAMAAVAMSPTAGGLADRFGRRPTLLAALAGLTVTNVAFMGARSVAALMVIRVLEGAFSAGLNPAAMGVVSDIAPDKERARWVGLVAGGASIGWVVGPALGGLLCDLGGTVAPYGGAALLNLIAFVAVIALVPESAPRLGGLTLGGRWRKLAKSGPANATKGAEAGRGRPAATPGSPLTRDWRALSLLFALTFVSVFAWGFVEPRLMFYVYDDLGWNTGLFGLAVSLYGAGLVLGGMFLGHLVDRWGQRPVLAAAAVLHSLQYLGFALTRSYPTLLVTQSLAGVGEALINTAITAGLMDITPSEHRARVMGYKNAAYSLGSMTGPLLTSVAADRITPRQTFGASGVTLVAGAGLVLATLERQAAKTNEASGPSPLAKEEAK